MNLTATNPERDQDETMKLELLERIRQERRDWQALLNEVGERRMNEPGPMGGRTFKDLVAHLTHGWQREVQRLEAALRDTRPADYPSPDGVADLNRRIYEANRDRPLPDVLFNAQAVWDEFEEMVQALPESDLFEPDRFEWMNGQPLGPAVVDAYVSHWRGEREAEVRRWLAK